MTTKVNQELDLNGVEVVAKPGQENQRYSLADDAIHLESSKTGFHSVMLHETGHAIDYIAEKIPELNHRETIDTFYEADLKRAKAGDNHFTTQRADDNAREYFAEAVEAYLTEEVPSSDLGTNRRITIPS